MPVAKRAANPKNRQGIVKSLISLIDEENYGQDNSRNFITELVNLNEAVGRR
jgi:hypothetical protein